MFLFILFNLSFIADKNNLNTSHVLIYRNVQDAIIWGLNNLNTSHVLIYHNRIPMSQQRILVFKYISCSYLSLFNTGKQKIKKI